MRKDDKKGDICRLLEDHNKLEVRKCPSHKAKIVHRYTQQLPIILKEECRQSKYKKAYKGRGEMIYLLL